jgi:cytochrome c-type biogenesis protein CcmH/NrfG
MTLAEVQGMTEALGRAAAAVAAEEIACGRLATGREILEGLAVTNPHDPAPWAMLSVVERRRGRLLAARVCAEVAYRLAPSDAQVRLVRAESLLGSARDRPAAVEELEALSEMSGAVGVRATALLLALGRAG